MAKIDKIKELIGYLKVVFGVLVAVDISMIGWLFKNQDDITKMKIAIVAIAIIAITISIIFVNRKILEKIDQLEEL